MSSGTAPQVVCRPVGIVHSRFTEAAGMPIQTAGAPEETGSLEVFAEFAPGLRDIEGVDYLIFVTHSHRCAHERLPRIRSDDRMA